MTGTSPDHPPTVSLELFPPKTEAGITRLDDTVACLASVGPEYFSVTYGAGGSTREHTGRVVDMVARRTRLPVAHHLTCLGATRTEIDAQARDLWARGIRRIVALRGDLAKGESTPPDGYRDAAELVAGLRRIADFDISVAAYPEVHPEAASPRADLDHLKRKLDAGATRAITQFAFDTDGILRFIDRTRAAGIDAPIVPGIMPVANFASLKRFAANCGASIPGWLETMFDGLDDTPGTRDMVAASVASEQCRRLIAGGVGAFHIYTLNRAEISLAICRTLGMTPDIRAAAAA